MTETLTMMELRAPEITACTGGVLVKETTGIAGGVSTDTRTLQTGDLFVALRGDRFDGHGFLDRAFAAGAWGALVDDTFWRSQGADRKESLGRTGAIILVGDTERGLGDLALGYRRSLDLPVVAVTGSNGKTTTKEMTASIASCRMEVHRTVGNLNNQIGLPLTILGIEERHEAVVLEMGMNHRGEIARLTEIGDPDIGVITNVGAAHLEHLGSLQAVAEAKAELLAGLKAGGRAVLNADDEMLPVLRSFHHGELLTFGLTAGADYRADGISYFSDGTLFLLHAPEGSVDVRMPFTGAHNVRNALAAAAAASLVGATLEDARDGLARAVPADMRFTVRKFRREVTVVNDAYNANPDSMGAALSSLELMPAAGRRAAVLGDMLELGESSAAAHRRLGAAAAACSFDLLLAVGRYAGDVAAGAVGAGFDRERMVQASDAVAAAGILGPWLGEGDLVLLKGSRGIGLEKVIPELVRGGFLERDEA